MNAKKEQFKQIERYIIADRIKDALDKLYEFFDSVEATEQKHQTIQQINQLNRLNEQERDRTISQENLSIQKNQIVKATLGLLSAAEQLTVKPKTTTTDNWQSATDEDLKPIGDIFKEFNEKWNTSQSTNSKPPNTLKQLFYDDFTDNRNNWNIGPIQANYNYYPTNAGNTFIAESQCVIDSGLNGVVNVWKQIGINRFTEFIIESQVCFWIGNNFGFGLIWGANPANFDSYYFLISQIGQFCIGYQMNGNSINLANWVYSPYIWQGVNANKLKLHRIGDQVHFYINDQQVFSTTYYTFFGDYIGMSAVNVKKVSFDYLSIWN